MKILLDTHYVIWMVSDPAELTSAETALIRSEASELLVSAISLWELRVKADAERRRGRSGALEPASAIAFIRRADLKLIDLRPDDCVVELRPELKHPDPFDGMLLVHAQQLGARLLTRDGKLHGHPLALRA